MTTWLQHVKKVHAAGSTSFKESLKRASASWKKQKGSSAAKAAKPKKKKRGKRKSAEAEASTEEPEEEAAPKKKRRRKAKRSMPKIPAEAYKSVDNRAV